MLALQLRTDGGFWVVGPMMAQHMILDCNIVIFRNLIFILIMQKLYNILFYKVLYDFVL